MASFCSRMFFKILLVVIVTFISAVSGGGSVTMFTLKNDPVKEHCHTSEDIVGTREMNKELQRKNGVLVEKLKPANQQNERYTFEEYVSDDFEFTSDFVGKTVLELLAIRIRRVKDGPYISLDQMKNEVNAERVFSVTRRAVNNTNCYNISLLNNYRLVAKHFMVDDNIF